MSISRKEIVTCPNCNTKGEAVVWFSLNTELDPQAKVELLEGNLFKYTCPHCGTEFSMGVDMLYHQPDLPAMIQLANSQESAQNAKEQFDALLENGMPGGEVGASDFYFRIVRDPNELREKVILLDHNLDDRVIEIMKILARAQMFSQDPNLDVKFIYFNVREDGEYEFTVRTTDERWGSYPYDPKVYDMIVDELVSDLKLSAREYFVNGEWAVSKLGNM